MIDSAFSSFSRALLFIARSLAVVHDTLPPSPYTLFFSSLLTSLLALLFQTETGDKELHLSNISFSFMYKVGDRWQHCLMAMLLAFDDIAFNQKKGSSLSPSFSPVQLFLPSHARSRHLKCDRLAITATPPRCHNSTKETASSVGARRHVRRCGCDA